MIAHETSLTVTLYQYIRWTNPPFVGKEHVQRNLKKQYARRDDDDLLPLSTGNDVQMRRRVATSPPPSSLMKAKKGRRVVLDDSDSETPVEEDGGVTDSDGDGPLTQETPRRARTRQAVSISSDSDDENEAELDHVGLSQSLPNQAAADEDSDDQLFVTPRSSMPRRRGRQAIDLDGEDDDEEDEDEDEAIQTPAKRRRLLGQKGRAASVSMDSGSEGSGTLRARLKSKPTLNMRGSSPPTSTARSMRSTARKGHRSEKGKKLELLRRRRAGEKNLTMEDLASSEDDEDGGLYDTDSDHQALEVFDDESEPEEDAPTKKSKKKTKTKQPARKSSPVDGDANSEDDDFIDDDDSTLGVPDEALHLIPLEFTRASRKPLKAHFRDAVEWLVHRKINPGFDKDNEVYVTAWRRLSDEVTGLANSKFVSSVWRPDFHRALKARPYIEPLELGAGHLAVELKNCQACGRSGHSASWAITFTGKPYDSRTLDEVESDSEDDEEESGDHGMSSCRLLSYTHMTFYGLLHRPHCSSSHHLPISKIQILTAIRSHLRTSNSSSVQPAAATPRQPTASSTGSLRCEIGSIPVWKARV